MATTSFNPNHTDGVQLAETSVTLAMILAFGVFLGGVVAPQLGHHVGHVGAHAGIMATR